MKKIIMGMLVAGACTVLTSACTMEKKDAGSDAAAPDEGAAQVEAVEVVETDTVEEGAN